MEAANLQTVPVPAALPAPASGVGARAFDGLEWSYRADFDRILSRVPAKVWTAPQRQGWQLIKQNPRREVWRAELAGATLYLKYFRRHPLLPNIEQLFRALPCRKEWEGGLFALRSGIGAVRPAGVADRIVRDGRPWSLLVTEAAEHAEPLNEFWSRLCADDDAGRRRRDQGQVIELLGELIARAHQSGFEHLDMHAANILVQPIAPRRYRALFVDLQSARRGTPVSDHAVVRNLAQLNQWFRRHSTVADRLRFVRSYLRNRDRFESEAAHGRTLGMNFSQLVAALAPAAAAQANRIWSQRDRRTCRDGSYFKKLKLADGWRGVVTARCKHGSADSIASRLAFSREWWRQCIGDPAHWFAADQSASCKNSHSASVRRAVLEHPDGSIPVIIKRPVPRNWRRMLAQWLGPSRVLRGWRIGLALLNRDLPAARPLAVLERRWGPFLVDSLLITEAAPGGIDLEAYLRRESALRGPRAWALLKHDIGARLVREVRRLQERGFSHRDCKASNVLVVPHPAPRLIWIDMDGLRRRVRLTLRDLVRPLMRLHVSLLDVPGLTRTDRVRFLKGYHARFGADVNAWRDTWRAVAAESADKLRAQEARRAWKLRHYGRV